MGEFFNPEKGIWAWLSTLVDLVGLSILWIFLSLPVVTIGPASAALYDAAVHGIRREEAGYCRRFFHTFRRELKTAVPAWLLWGAAAIALLLGGQYGIGAVIQSPGPVLAATAVLVLLLFLVLGVMAWMFPLLSRFEFSFGALNRTAVQLWIVHLPSSVLLVLMTAGCVWACWRLLFPVFFLPCTLALLSSFLLERAFAKHLPEEAQ